MNETNTETAAETPQQATKETNILAAYREMKNIAAEKGGANLDDETLSAIGSYVDSGVKRDDETRTKWIIRYDDAIKNAMQEKETKHTPFSNASNVKYPFIASAAQQFHARSYGAIIKGKDIVKGKVSGKDPDNQMQIIADAVAEHMSNQLLEEMIGWVDGLDKTLGMLPIVGCVFKKTYYSQIKRMNVSEYITAKDVIIKYDAVSVEEAPRVTHPQTYTKNEILSFIRSGQWREDANDIIKEDAEDKDSEYNFYECHCWYDLDGDDYDEPYVITIEKDTMKVVRIVSRYDLSGIEQNDKGEILRIKAIDYFTRYLFLTSPDGGVYGMGFGTLLGAINDTVDTLINQLIDAGTLSNTGGGFISKKVKLGKKRQSSMAVKGNEWKIVDTGQLALKDAILPLPTKEPSSALFSLLGMMIQSGKELSSVTELMTGESRGSNESPTTVMALIEQGTMVFTAIYKRIYQSLKSEFKKIHRLNKIHLAEQEGNEKLAQAYRMRQFDIIPIADPQDATNTQKIAKANALQPLHGRGYNDAEIDRRYLEAIGIENVDAILTPPPKQPEPPNPMMIIEEGKFNLAMDKQRLDRSKFEWQMIVEKQKDILESVSKMILNLANAEAAEIGPQLEQYHQQVQSLRSEMDGRISEEQSQQDRSDAGGMGVSPEQQGLQNAGPGIEGGVGGPAGGVL